MSHVNQLNHMSHESNEVDKLSKLIRANVTMEGWQVRMRWTKWETDGINQAKHYNSLFISLDKLKTQQNRFFFLQVNVAKICWDQLELTIGQEAKLLQTSTNTTKFAMFFL